MIDRLGKDQGLGGEVVLAIPRDALEGENWSGLILLSLCL